MALATHDDANRWLDGTKIKFDTEASSEDDRLKVEPIVRAALIDLYPDNIDDWDVDGTPEAVPELVRDVVSMLMAAYLYQRRYSEETQGPSSFGMNLEKRAMRILQDLRTGSLSLADKAYTSQLGLSSADFWPNDSTTVPDSTTIPGLSEGDPLRAFTMDRKF